MSERARSTAASAASTLPETRPTRTRWTDSDFEEMNWHDVHIHAIAAVPATSELLFDVDYITEWYCDPVDKHASFLLTPATLVFHMAAHVDLQVSTERGIISILEMLRTDWFKERNAEVGTWKWVFKCEKGEIEFRASGYCLYLRGEAARSDDQYLDSSIRGRPSFAHV